MKNGEAELWTTNHKIIIALLFLFAIWMYSDILTGDF